MKKYIISLAICAFVLTGCNFQFGNLNSGKTGIANPASTYCEQQGNKLEIRKNDDGSEASICVLPNNVECDEWAYFRKECPEKVN
ncbi:MAG: DUF333 domain-containing protein [Patescibacteria group bacterium]|nr:DUF333 domain-containing protein [Patescibacteria group bacterium]